MKAMESLQDLIEEAKVRTVLWGICVFGLANFLSMTSKSIWMNIPIAFLMFSGLRMLFYEVEFRWKERRPVRQASYLSHLRNRQVSVDDPRLCSPPITTSWKRKLESPVVEAAIDDFISKIIQDFMVDLWYSEITPDKEVPELTRALINDVIGEVAQRVKGINLVDLLTRDVVDLVGNHLDLYRKNQSAIGEKVMGSLSFEERDERLLRHLIASKELHPALLSPECEYKVLHRLMAGVLAIVLRPQEAWCPLARSISREFLTCIVMQPVMNFASPGYINELIEYLVLSSKEYQSTEISSDHADTSNHMSSHGGTSGVLAKVEPDRSQTGTSPSERKDLIPAKSSDAMSLNTFNTGNPPSLHQLQPRPADWARILDAAQQRRTQVLAPENLENLWARGRNYKNKSMIPDKTGLSSEPIGLRPPAKTTGGAESREHDHKGGKDVAIKSIKRSRVADESTTGLHATTSIAEGSGMDIVKVSKELSKEPNVKGVQASIEENTSRNTGNNKRPLKRSGSSTSALYDMGKALATGGAEDPTFNIQQMGPVLRSASEMVVPSDGSPHAPKLKCRVVGAYFEKSGSKSFAVYSIAVTNVENKTWFVKRRYRNFERLHRHLKDIPNYSLHLPPKRFLSSSIDDYFVHQRCILLDKYLQDLLSISNVAEQHEVWDFLSVSSKNYSFGKTPSVMKTLAVNVDDAMDDIFRQLKDVSRKVVGSSSSPHETCSILTDRYMSLPWNEDEIQKHSSSYGRIEGSRSPSEDEGHVKDTGNGDVNSPAQLNGWHSDNELNSKNLPPRVIKRSEDSQSLGSESSRRSEVKLDTLGSDGITCSNSLLDDPIGVPPEWTPPNVSVPLLNLVDKMFQLNRRGWLRRQVFWISKQILQLMMEDAIDDWLLRQIHWLRRDEVIAFGIRWVQDVLWPQGTFFMKVGGKQLKSGNSDFSETTLKGTRRDSVPKDSVPASFEQQLEAARRASDVKKMIFGGAPSTLVSLIGRKQYRRCARDIYFFLQSTICVKQLGYGILELLLVSIFPELHDVIVDIHEKQHF
ncbi:uncharacterized protein LOC18446044 isoform X1 [Amborella trichopoda]|uniref:uncharacterized protein LOC18446044 isoform X1 n=1 Tax=Amborella trichopoda TaxID=13333 RepID=UPI0005D3EB96|nr:uncharacterized protein LOC18446044 isoform X1 [Amborella trichopoda]|eukprot:XP_011627743.1 uncharacterized protein LOC18446044 isoform X1 [Amborella trichopoda]